MHVSMDMKVSMHTRVVGVSIIELANVLASDILIITISVNSIITCQWSRYNDTCKIHFLLRVSLDLATYCQEVCYVLK